MKVATDNVGHRQNEKNNDILDLVFFWKKREKDNLVRICCSFFGPKRLEYICERIFVNSKE